jgi:adenosylcobinamide kinase/adenosylcobinamide-phosphate guanylyltransferase
VLVLGGARSGKSSLAESLCARLAGEGPVLFVATAQAGDDEMRQRIAEHQRRRPAQWRTLEEPLRLAAALPGALRDARVVLLDCATLWAANLLLDGGTPDEEIPPQVEEAALAEVEAFLDVVRASSATFVVVSNEVGLGLVPPYPLGRAYRDLLGRANQRLAAAADKVYFLVAGLPVELKALSRSYGLDLPGDGEPG